MPAPNKSNPICLKCWFTAIALIPINQHMAIALLSTLPRMRKNGFHKQSGLQKYRCDCRFTATEGDRPSHRPPIGDRAMTQLERDQKYRLNHPEKYKAIHRCKKGHLTPVLNQQCPSIDKNENHDN